MADPALLGPVDSGITVARCAPAQAFVIDFSDGEMKSKENKKNLQESFLRFKKQKQKEIRDEKRLRARRLRAQGDPLYMDKLRKKFIKTAKKYYGVPYAKKYWKPEQPEFRSPIFLDCCGLVRQVMYDLRKDFGFRLGPWNQAYMFDTLPLVVESEENMKPGDLVFMSGVYPRPQARQQKHYMTHVEIWAGQGTKTIGARWNNGKVSLWDDYRFEAKSFTDAKYHFRSIDTWLQGICRSFCPEHKWKRSSYNANKKSIFNVENQKKKKKKHTKSAHVGERPSESREKAGQSQSQEQKENGLQSPQEDKQDSVDQLEENDILDIENDSILSPLNLDDVDIEDEDDEDEDDQEEDVDDGEEEEEDPVEAACDSDIEELQGGLSVQGFGTTRDKRKTVESPSRIEFRPETNLLSITRLTQINRNLSHMLEQYPIFPRLSWRPEDSVFDKKNHRFSFKSFQNSPFHIKSPRSEINNSLQKENSSLGFVKISGRCMTAEQNTRVHSQPSDYKEESEETRRLKERMARFTLTNASDIPSPRLQRSYTTLSKSYLGNHSTVSPRCRQQRPLGISPTVCRFPVILNDIDTLNNKFVPEGVLKMNKDRLNQSKGQTHQNDPKDQENIFSIHKKSIEERWTAFNKLEKSHPVLLMSKEATELETDNKNNNVPKEESLGHEQEDIDYNKVDDVSTHKSPFNISSSQDETMALPSFSELRHTVDISQYGGEGMMTLDLSIPPPVDSPLDDRQG